MRAPAFFFLLCFLFLTSLGIGQCPFDGTLSGSNLTCGSGLLTASSSNPAAKVVWYKDGVAVGTTIPTGRTVTTVAGGGNEGPAPSQIGDPTDVYVDAHGNLYIADWYEERIQEWAPGATYGVTVAGGNGPGAAGNQFGSVDKFCVDAAGNIYVSDGTNNRVQKWAPGATTGVTVAGGNGQGPASNQFDGNKGVAVDGAGNLYVVDEWNNRVQEWAPGATSGVTVAGGTVGGTLSNLYEPVDLKIGPDGSLYIDDMGNYRILKWVPGAPSGSIVAGGNGYGSAANQLIEPGGIFVDAVGNVYVADGGNDRIQLWAPGATRGITVAGGWAGGGNGMNQLNMPFAVFVDALGDLYVADADNNRIQKWGPMIDPTYNATAPGSYTAVITDVGDCSVTTNAIVIAGPPDVTIGSTTTNCAGAMLQANTSENDLSQLIWYNGGQQVKSANASNATGQGKTVAGGNGYGYADNQIENPDGLLVDANGDVFVSDPSNNRVQKWTPGATSGVTVAGGAGAGTSNYNLSGPSGMAVDAVGNLYICNGLSSVMKWTPGANSGVQAVYATSDGGPSGLMDPTDVVLANDGNLYICDWENNRVQRWAIFGTSGVTVAGGNGPGSAANQLYHASWIWVDANLNVYVSDAGNNRIQKWAPGATSGVTVAGGNGAGSAANQLDNPEGIFFDAAGNLYIADMDNNRIQKWAPGATVGVTVAGGNGAGSNANQLYWPEDVYVDGSGNIYITDAYNRRVVEWGQQLALDKSYGPAAPGTYTATVTTSAGCTATTNTVIVEPIVTPAVSVAASGTAVCSGTPIVFTATPTNGGTTPMYQWQVDGVANGAATSSAVFSVSNLPDGNMNVSCVMTSNADCPQTPTAASTAVAITVTPAVTPAITITASAPQICTGGQVVFTATPVNGGSSPVFTWKVGNTTEGSDAPTFSTNTLHDGDVVSVVMDGDQLCGTLSSVTSNAITMRVYATVAATVAINAYPGNTVCSADSMQFSAQVVNGGNAPSFEWLLNGQPVGANGPVYTDLHPVQGDVVSCNVQNTPNCPASVSNSVSMIVNQSPVVPPGQVIDMAYELDGTLEPQVSGNDLTYAWSPTNGLSDPTIRNPVAYPTSTTDYTLTVADPQGCRASGTILVKVSAAVIRIPSAFSPNGDGKNDVFYVIGGPVGTVVKSFAVFDRWGQCLFQVHDVPTGDPDYGWNGAFKGSAVMAGTYVYALVVKLPDGSVQQLKGTVIVVR